MTTERFAIFAARVGRVCLGSLTAAVLAACGERTPVVVGVAGGQSFVDAVVLAIDDFGPFPVPVDTVTTREGTNQAGPAIGGAEALVATPGLVGVVGHTNSAASIAASQIYNQAGVVQIAPTSSATLYTRAGPFSFRLVPPDDRQGAFLARLLEERLPDGGGVALFYINDDYGRGLRASFTESLDTLRYPVLVELAHMEQEIDETEITQAGDALEARPVDAVIWLARGTVLSRYLPVIREVVPDVPILAGDALGSYAISDDDRPLWNGIVYVGLVDLDRSDLIREVRRRYEIRFGSAPRGPDLLAYDAASLLLEGIADGADTGEELRDFLLSLGRDRPRFEGVTGPVEFDENGDIDRPYVVEVIGPPGAS